MVSRLRAALLLSFMTAAAFGADHVIPDDRDMGSDRAFPMGAEPGTISLWFVRPPHVEDKVLFAYGRTEKGCVRGLWLVKSDQVCFYFWGWPQDLHARIPGGIAPNQWHHLAGTYDGSEARVYFNGRLAGRVKTELNTKPGGRFFRKRNLVQDNRGIFPGPVKGVRIYDRALPPEEIQAMYKVGKDARPPVRFTEPDLKTDVDTIVFAVRQVDTDGHWYANFGNHVLDQKRTYYHEGGRLCLLHLKTGKVTTLLADEKGGVRDPQVHYDGRKILFAYRKGGQPHYHLHEIGVDGRGLKQLTDGPYDDFEPTYLPSGDIIFCSSRCQRWVPCYHTQVAVLYRCDADGRHIRQLSANTEQENTPWVMPDGRILYQRWEYVDRSQIGYHHLWSMNPDGTGQMVYYGNQAPNTVMIDAKPIPGTQAVVASFSPGHGRNEHAGIITRVDPRGGPDHGGMARALAPGIHLKDPYPLTEKLFLAADATRLFLMDELGRRKTLFTLPSGWRKGRMQVHEPRPVRARPREPVIPDRAVTQGQTGRVMLQDIYEGRNMQGIRRGEVKSLLVLEILPKPFNIFSGMEPLSYGGTFLLERALGTVPVAEDGSAHVEVPALRPLFFVALDREGMSIKRMQSFLTVQPGESMSCVGCHEQRVQAPRVGPAPLAMRRPPSRIEPVADVPALLDFPRDVQPILDRHCVACHDYEATQQGGPRGGGVILSGDRGPMFSHSYYNLTIAAQFRDGRNLRESNYPPRSIGSSASPLLKKLDGGHYDAKLSDREKKVLRLWIDTGAAYPGTYAAMGTGSIGYYPYGGLDRSDLQWPEMQAARKVIHGRCAACHEGKRTLPDSPSDNRGMVPWNEGPMNALATGKSQLRNPVFLYNRHNLYNLSRPAESLLVLAPLAKDAGGYGICENGKATVFKTTDDGDYQILLAGLKRAKVHLDAIKRFDMPGFRPGPQYVRELIRYGVLPADRDQEKPVDPYQADSAYWDSVWRRALGGGM